MKRITINSNDTATNANSFASTLNFFAETQGNAKKIKRAYKPTNSSHSKNHCKLGRTQHRTDSRAADNTGLTKVAVQCYADTFVVNQSLVLASTFVVKIAIFAKPETVI